MKVLENGKRYWKVRKICQSKNVGAMNVVFSGSVASKSDALNVQTVKLKFNLVGISLETLSKLQF